MRWIFLQIPATAQIESADGTSYHSSTLVVSPTHTDDGSVVVCQASNPQLPEETLYDSVKLSVLCKYLYKPIDIVLSSFTIAM